MKSAEKQSLLRVAFTSNATAQQAPMDSATGNATTTQQPPAKPVALLDLARNKLRNKHATSSEKDAQQATLNQGMVVARENEQIDEAQEARRLKVLTLLQNNPEMPRAIIADSDSDPDHVILTIAVRSVVTFDLIIEKARFDPFQLLGLMDLHSTNTH